MNSSDQTGGYPRAIRSFVRRTGRLTVGQQRALNELWPRWGIELPDQRLALNELFGREAPRVVEIGFGDGDSLLAMAAAEPQHDFLGIEVHEPGVGHCLLGIESAGLSNVRLIQHDAVEVLRDWLPVAAFQRVQLFFPDPWPKKRHHKRRIVQPSFVDLLAAILVPGGIFHAATDWANYAEHIEATLAGRNDFIRAGHRLARPGTKFERRGARLGHAITDLYFQRC